MCIVHVYHLKSRCNFYKTECWFPNVAQNRDTLFVDHGGDIAGARNEGPRQGTETMDVSEAQKRRYHEDGLVDTGEFANDVAFYLTA